ncbi:MAG: leucyl/phenylalanyl-tRNA--protein transferase [Verrucomicrobiales bacterium]
MIEPEFLIKAYRMGIFPMALDGGEIGWFSPDPRGIIPLEEFHLPHGLRRSMRSEGFDIRVNRSFEGVMRGCAEREETWINEIILRSFCELHRLGYAHSVEAWRGGELVGGLYGVSIGGAFFGESMFSRESNASKVALAHLVQRMRSRGLTLLDTQWTNPHLEQFGCREVSRRDYLERLRKALQLGVRFA